MRDRVDALDWAALATEVDASGSAQTAPVLTPDECVAARLTGEATARR